MSSPEPSIHIRIYRGIAEHFVFRWTEWAMLWPTFGLWIGLQLDPTMFSKSPSFAHMSAWGDERQWSFVFGVAMICRAAALAINGTFKGFEFSPHIRAAASLVGILIWSQVSLGILQTFLDGKGAFSGFVAYSLPVMLELMNAYRSWKDVGKQFPADR